MNVYLNNKENSIIWNIKLAIKIANLEKIKLNSNHWKVIYTLRNLYFKYKIHPNLRILINKLKKQYKDEIWDSVSLFNLFPNGVIKQASKIAGIPNNNICL
ncbi:TusE/DsrC/DsvC family sulfur relay protein [Enterobacteriaceae endosymbiont of Donacia provostii]|uniref:TusE/DsrC/DsvC family sulfur relay protein n=1 Tax=Enterobacteriaceae endosymbiont of Donacia provostii TaxID=2675781 RepID=UPI0014496E2E|nr:TusE/DsrC/DsvC family sulfur relay protein [Enterobacteriaceae endosymbiont of Donacia provostii]QJC33515.1 TusE/DsrC/DsvC family sulfur relay protein [Enterobacteriaceae endosymbiont of Donacia provostii]